MLNSPEYAIRFGESVEKGLERQRAFPFTYTMIPVENDNWERDKSTANLTGIGPTVPAASTLLHPVRMHQDHPFLMLWMKFTVYYDLDDTYHWYEPHTGWFQEQFDYNMSIGTPLLDSIDISTWFQGPDGRILYGGTSLSQIDGGVVNGKIPVPINTVQGYDFGYAQLRTPYFLPPEAAIMFEITNRHALKDLTIGAAIYGLKVRV